MVWSQWLEQLEGTLCLLELMYFTLWFDTLSSVLMIRTRQNHPRITWPRVTDLLNTGPTICWTQTAHTWICLSLYIYVCLIMHEFSSFFKAVISLKWKRESYFHVLLSEDINTVHLLWFFFFKFLEGGMDSPVSMLICRMSMWHTYVSHKDQHGQVLWEGHPGTTSGVSQSWRAKVYSIGTLCSHFSMDPPMSQGLTLSCPSGWWWSHLH